MNAIILMILGFLFGIGFGFFVQRGGICFAHGLGEIFIGKGKRILTIFLTIFIITSIGFYLIGPKTVGAIRGFGLYNILSGIIFGAGIFLSGGCILGILRQLGEGNLLFAITFVSFIPGMALIVYVVNPLIESTYNTQHSNLWQLFGLTSGGIVVGVMALLAAGGLYYMHRKSLRA